MTLYSAAAELTFAAGSWLRRWRRSPWFTAQLVITVTVGMGTLTALVSTLLAVSYEKLPFRDPDRLVAIWERVESGAAVAAISGPDIADYGEATRQIFSSFGAFAVRKLWLLDRRGESEVRTCYIEGRVFSDLGIVPSLGRGVVPSDEPLGDGAPAWIGYDLWQRRYGGSPSILGSTLDIATSQDGTDQIRLRIAGVLPPGTSLPLPFADGSADVWYLAPPTIASLPRQAAVFFALGRLRPNVTMAEARSALTAVSENLEPQHNAPDRRKRPVVEAIEETAQAPARQTVGLLSFGVALVFVVGCVNLAILMGTEGRRRRREIAIRIALGARHRHLLHEVAVEKSALTLVSLGLGIALASLLVRVLYRLLPAAGLGRPLLHPPPLNVNILSGFAAFAVAGVLLWSGLVVISAKGRSASSQLPAAGSGPGYAGFNDSSPGWGRWRLWLLAGEVATGICLLAAALIATKTYASISAADLGPDPNHTIVLSIDTRDNVNLSESQILDFNQEMLSRLARLPGTRAIGLADLFPPPGLPISFIKRGESHDVQRAATLPVSVSPGYFGAVGIPLVVGRNFEATDNKRSEPVAIISLKMAAQNWPSPTDAIGSQISFGPQFLQHYTIIGVVSDFTGYWSLKAVPTVYLPESQTLNWCGAIILQTETSPRKSAALLSGLLAGMSVPVTVSDVSTMRWRWQQTLTRPAARMAGMLLLALLGFGLSVQGVYAVAAGTVTARRHELAVRSALGAMPDDLVWSVMKEQFIAVTAGITVGVIAAMGFHRVLEQWLGPKAVWQSGPIVLAIVSLGVAAVLGCYGPARAAARANPLEVLRQS